MKSVVIGGAYHDLGSSIHVSVVYYHFAFREEPTMIWAAVYMLGAIILLYLLTRNKD